MSGSIPLLRVSKLKDREIESILSLVIKLLEESGFSSDIFLKLIGQLKKLLILFQQSLNKQRKNEFTITIRETDELRNKLLGTLWKGVTFFLTMEGTPIADAAVLLEKVLDKYGKGITRESDKVETVTIRSLLTDLSGTDEVAALEVMGLTDTISALTAANEKFDELYLKRAADDAEDSTPSLVRTRKTISDTLYLLVYLVNFYTTIEPETYATLAGELTEIIGDAMSVAKARETRNSHEEESPVNDEISEGEFDVSEE